VGWSFWASTVGGRGSSREREEAGRRSTVGSEAVRTRWLQAVLVPCTAGCLSGWNGDDDLGVSPGPGREGGCAVRLRVRCACLNV
jgi:hypothetical protein